MRGWEKARMKDIVLESATYLSVYVVTRYRIINLSNRSCSKSNRKPIKGAVTCYVLYCTQALSRAMYCTDARRTEFMDGCMYNTSILHLK